MIAKDAAGKKTEFCNMLFIEKSSRNWPNKATSKNSADLDEIKRKKKQAKKHHTVHCRLV